VVAVQVHRMRLAAVVGDRHADHVALGYQEHGDVREQVAVYGPEQPGTAVEEARPAVDVIDEAAIGTVRVERQRLRRPIAK
jgi:hypothetical protein